MLLCYIVLSLPAVLYVIGTNAECNLEEAELRAAEYGKRFDSEAADFRRTSRVSDSFMSLCIEKLNGSETSAEFWNSTNSCLLEEADYVIQQWNETEEDVNALCVDACPKYAFFPPSTHIVDMAALTEERYTDFCRSMNMSMTYAKGNATNCLFEMSIYYSFLPHGARKFWNDVCQLGCSNLDISIPSIIRCHGDIAGRTPTCVEHWDFKQCIYKRGVCMDVVEKYYADFYQIEKLCITTTSTTKSTTTTPTTTTIVSTATSTIATTITTSISTDTTILYLSSSETAREKETSQVPVSSVTPFISPLTSSSESTTTPGRMLNISACITEADHQLFSQNFPNLTKELIMKVLKIESCLYRLDNDPNIVTKAVANLPPSFQEMFIRVQKDGFDILSTLPECVKPKHKDVNCNGHNYGILACSGDAPGSTKVLLFLSTLILLERYFQ
ncbi:hypothetical protein CHS0354_025397 [Potamilus streckersoni]|uniref:Uncharacterized protein n=1 Tax=Potamilus streckersoni TaxID=2493646 RepID=A0AAE0SQD9_9BIVA|nr:hypothetical protein CHS0354_025397 [Potamilus streckersoni]